MHDLPVVEIGNGLKEVFHESSNLRLVELDGPEEFLNLMV